MNIGDIVKTKKPHVCGSNEWEVLRVGVELKLECIKCHRQIMVGRLKFNAKMRING